MYHAKKVCKFCQVYMYQFIDHRNPLTLCLVTPHTPPLDILSVLSKKVCKKCKVYMYQVMYPWVSAYPVTAPIHTELTDPSQTTRRAHRFDPSKSVQFLSNLYVPIHSFPESTHIPSPSIQDSMYPVSLSKTTRITLQKVCKFYQVYMYQFLRGSPIRSFPTKIYA